MSELFYLIVNPTSAGNRGRTLWPKIESVLRELEIDFAFAFTAAAGDATRLTQEAIENGYRKLVAVGGDGTINEVVNGIFQQKLIASAHILLAVIPVGTGSDWIKTHGIPRNYRKAVKLLCGGADRFQDIGKIQFEGDNRLKTRYFNNIAGLAFDGFVVMQMNGSMGNGKGGRVFYLWEVLKNLFRFRAVETRLQGECWNYQGSTFCIHIAIGQYVGGGMRMAPRAIPDDGMFDVTIIQKISPWNVLRNILKLYNGRIYRHPNVRHYRGAQMDIQCTPETPVEADGEFLGYTPLRIEIIPEALQIRVPSDPA